MLLHFEREMLLLAGGGEVDGQRLVYGGDRILCKLHVDDRADDLDDFADIAHEKKGLKG
jgi:hypothetical protein